MDLYKNALALKVSGLNKTNKTSDFSLKNINIEVPYGSIVGNIRKKWSRKKYNYFLYTWYVSKR